MQQLKNSGRKLAVIGASYLQLPLVEKAKELGCEVHCFAWEKGAVCKPIADFFYPISILEKEKILDICREVGIDGVTSIASDAAVSTVAYIAHELNLIGNGIASATYCTDKYLMRVVLANAGLDVPNAHIVTTTKRNIKALPFPAIVKPTDRSGSRGVAKVHGPRDLILAVEEALAQSFSGRAVVEEFIEGREISVESISWRGQHYVVAITDKTTTGSPSFVEVAHHQPADLSTDICQSVIQATQASLSALGVEYGASHTELIIQSSGELVVVEVGARMGGDFIGSDLVELSTGYDYLGAVIDVAFGVFNPPQLTSGLCAGVYFLAAQTSSLLPYFTGELVVPGLVRLDYREGEIRHITQSAERSGYLIYQFPKKVEL